MIFDELDAETSSEHGPNGYKVMMKVRSVEGFIKSNLNHFPSKHHMFYDSSFSNDVKRSS